MLGSSSFGLRFSGPAGRAWLAAAVLGGCGIADLAAQALRSDVVTGGEVLAFGTRQPVVGATLAVHRDPWPGLPQELWKFMPPREPKVHRLRTDSRGRFAIRLPVGERVSVYATHGNQASLCARMTAGDFVRLDLRPMREVWGHITQGRGRVPLAGHPVELCIPAGDSGQSIVLRTVTDPKGVYRSRVPLGTWVRVATEGPGWYREVYVHDQVHNDLAIGVGKEGMRAQVLDGNGRPLVNCEVLDHHQPRRRTRTDGAGFFSFEKINDHGVVHILAPETHAMFHQYLKVKEPMVRGIVPGTRTRCRVIGPDAKPLAGARVVVAGIPTEVQSAHRLFVGRCYRTDAKGEVVLGARTDARSISLFVEHRGRFRWVFRGDSLAPMENAPLAVGSGVDLSTQIVDARGRPLENELVHLARRPDDQSKMGAMYATKTPLLVTRRTDRGGRTKFEGLAPGAYLLVTHPHSHFPQFLEVQVGSDGLQRRWRLPKLRTLSGLVTRNGTGVPGLGMVLLAARPPVHVPFRYDPLEWTMTRFHPMANVRTGPRGRFEACSLPSINLKLFLDRRVIEISASADWSNLTMECDR